MSGELNANLLNRIATPVDNYNNMVQGRQAVDMNQFNLENQKKTAERAEASAKVEKIASTLFGAKDPQDYATRVQYLRGQGIEFDPGEDAWENRGALQAQAMSLKDHLEQGKDARDFALKEDELGLKRDDLADTKQYRTESLAIEREKLAQQGQKPPQPFTLGPGARRYSPDGKLLAEAPPAPKRAGGMTATAQKELFDTEDNISNLNGASTALTKALALNDKIFSGYGAGAATFAARNDPFGQLDKEKGVNTTEFKNLIFEQALSTMKAVFGANPTEGERTALIELQAAPDKSAPERKRILDNAIKVIEKRIAYNKDKARDIRSGKFFEPEAEGEPNQQGGDVTFGEVGQIPEGAIVEDDDGNRYQKVNGTLEAVE